MFKEDRCYRPDEIAKAWAVDISTVYRKIRDIDNPLPAFRLDRQIRVLGHELNEFMENNKVNPAKE